MNKVAWVGVLGLLVGCGTIGAEPADGGDTGGSGGTVVTGAAGQATGGSPGRGGATGTAGATGAAGMTGAAGQAGGAGRGGAAGGPGVAGAGGTATGGRGGAGGTAGSTARGGSGGGNAGSGPGGSTARGGTGGGAAGNTGRGGTGGGNVTCASLENDYPKALSAARQCSATKPNQCQELVNTSLACPNCQVHVNDASKLKELTEMWTKLGCDKELRICPAVICQLPGPASCVAISSGDVCMDGKLVIDPPPISL